MAPLKREDQYHVWILRPAWLDLHLFPIFGRITSIFETYIDWKINTDSMKGKAYRVQKNQNPALSHYPPPGNHCSINFIQEHTNGTQ